LLRFDATVHALPSFPLKRREIEIAGQPVEILDVASNTLTEQLPRSFEAAAASLEQLPLLYFEPDGSFVWGKGADQERWQVDGLLMDGGERLQFVGLRGTCPNSALDQLLEAIAGPDAHLLFQLTREGVLLTADEFRRFAEISFQRERL
jgi:hypothetical protein